MARGWAGKAMVPARRARRIGLLAVLAAIALPAAPAHAGPLNDLLGGGPRYTQPPSCVAGAPGPADVRPGAALPFGFNQNLDLAPDGSPMTLDQQSSLEAGAGATVTRQVMGWGLIERYRGTYLWQTTDERYCSALRYGLRPLFTILGAPAWAIAGGCGGSFACLRPPDRDHDAALERFAQAVAQRYPKAIFEVWNEPNFEPFWGGPPDPARYVEVLRAVFRGVKAGNPTASVAGGSLMNAPFNSRTGERPAFVRMDSFLWGMYQYGAAQVMDAVSVHPYFFRRLDTPLSRFFATFDGQGEAFLGARQVMELSGQAGTPIWATETGIKPEGGWDGWAGHEAMADDLVRGYEWLVSQPDVELVVFHALLEHPCPPKRWLCNPDAAPGHSWLRQVTDMFGRPVNGRFTARDPYCRFARAYGTPVECDRPIPVP